MSAEIHIVLQGKGGVGKSVVSRLLIEHLIKSDRKYKAFDADAVNNSLKAVEGYDVDVVKLVDGSELDPRKFDDLVNEILELEDTSVVVDCGASSFLPLIGYMEQADTVETISSCGYEVFFHTVVTGGAAQNDTLAGYNQISERFGKESNVVVWTNPIFGEVLVDDIKFAEVPVIKKAVKDGNLFAVIQIPMLHRMTQEDFALFLKSNVSFGIALDKNSQVLNRLVKTRVAKVYTAMMSQIEMVLGEESNEAQSTDAG